MISRSNNAHHIVRNAYVTSALLAILVVAACRWEWTDGERYVVRLQKSYFAVREALAAPSPNHHESTMEQALSLCLPELLIDPVDGQSLFFNPELDYWREDRPWPEGELAVVAPRCADGTRGSDCVIHAFSFDLQLVAIKKGELPAWARK